MAQVHRKPGVSRAVIVYHIKWRSGHDEKSQPMNHLRISFVMLPRQMMRAAVLRTAQGLVARVLRNGLLYRSNDQVPPCLRHAARRLAQVPRSPLTVRTTFPVLCSVSTYRVASTTSSNG